MQKKSKLSYIFLVIGILLTFAFVFHPVGFAVSVIGIMMIYFSVRPKEKTKDEVMAVTDSRILLILNGYTKSLDLANIKSTSSSRTSNGKGRVNLKFFESPMPEIDRLSDPKGPPTLEMSLLLVKDPDSLKRIIDDAIARRNKLR
jgi:hypothetical protein